jgi:hypothetical protein
LTLSTGQPLRAAEHHMPATTAVPAPDSPLAAAHKRYTVAVRTLCEFTAKQGDLDLRFTPSATALEGVVGQAVVVARRGPHYQSELSLSGDFENLHVRGRADGYDADANRLEEIKAFRGDLNAMPDNRRQGVRRAVVQRIEPQRSAVGFGVLRRGQPRRNGAH